MKLLQKIAIVCLLAFGSSQVQAEEWIYTFRPGDTLWDLCEKYIAALDCWKKVAERNQIQQPRNIKPGTRLYLPIAWLKVLPASARVVATRGEVLVRRADTEEPEELASGTEILVGDTILTNEGTATLQFADESILIITPGSEVSFDTLTLYGESGMVDTRVRLNRGRARAKVRPSQGPGSRYEILTPAAVAAVRGTEFRVVSENVDPPQMRTEVLEGNVAVANESGEQTLAQGYALKAVSGETPQQPVRLLPPPALASDLPESITAFPWRLRWEPVSGASSYRLQVFRRGLLFDDLLEEHTLDQAGYTIPLLEEGSYRVTIRGIDNQGFEGMESAYRLEVVAPRETVSPEVNVRLDYEGEERALRWQWDAVEGATSYLVAVSADKGGDNQKHTQLEVADNQFVQGVSAPGVYRLKVAPLIGDQTLAFSEETSIRVRDESEPPVWVQAVIGAVLLIILF